MLGIDRSGQSEAGAYMPETEKLHHHDHRNIVE
jgi:hypothetical protein